MGNVLGGDVLGGSSGIINPGVKVVRICEECNLIFETMDNVITIKGPSRNQTKCVGCRDKIMNQFIHDLSFNN